eukprot:scaffold1290_cov248-Ochromonas_danica.AAC.36
MDRQCRLIERRIYTDIAFEHSIGKAKPSMTVFGYSCNRQSGRENEAEYVTYSLTTAVTRNVVHD